MYIDVPNVSDNNKDKSSDWNADIVLTSKLVSNENISLSEFTKDYFTVKSNGKFSLSVSIPNLN